MMTIREIKSVLTAFEQGVPLEITNNGKWHSGWASAVEEEEEFWACLVEVIESGCVVRPAQTPRERFILELDCGTLSNHACETAEECRSHLAGFHVRKFVEDTSYVDQKGEQ